MGGNWIAGPPVASECSYNDPVLDAREFFFGGNVRRRGLDRYNDDTGDYASNEHDPAVNMIVSRGAGCAHMASLMFVT